ncbi:hypothetical protein GO730_04895 [Spirosoma sp. HMF3257]|uniref:Uncharacterized protein n=1 Tax=Spirosoma telluris TaxID=2183553 RepID=A0A327NF85_9BACT|nr:hypothetical protein [Spirosoma telluris]RAI73882.1 hypothetical protein HMF3257_04865 [Spirosoma telluris]
MITRELDSYYTMTLFLKAITQDGQLRDFAFDFHELEKTFDFLSSIVSKGETLLEAYIIDEEGGHTPLPVAAFDGQPFSETILELQREWLLALQVSGSSLISDECRKLRLKRMNLLKASLVDSQRMLCSLDKLYKRTEERFTIGSAKTYMLQRYSIMITREKAFFHQLRVYHQLAFMRYHQLK